jgi:hypothetical protein
MACGLIKAKGQAVITPKKGTSFVEAFTVQHLPTAGSQSSRIVLL